MPTQTQRRWYTKKRVLLPAASVAALLYFGAADTGTPAQNVATPILAELSASQAPDVQRLLTETEVSARPVKAAPPTQPLPTTLPERAEPAHVSPVSNESASADSPLIVRTQPSAAVLPSVDNSSDDYYTNVDGERIHRPMPAASAPEGASARCRDGTYSFSVNRRGTCSHHGGVAEWL